MKAIRWEAFFFVAVLLWLIVWMSVSSRHSQFCWNGMCTSRQATAANMSMPGRWIWILRVSHRYRKIRTRTFPTLDFSFFSYVSVSVYVGGCECVYVCAAVQCFVPLKLWNIYLKPIWYTCFGRDVFYCQIWWMKAFSCRTLFPSLFWPFLCHGTLSSLKSWIILNHRKTSYQRGEKVTVNTYECC